MFETSSPYDATLDAQDDEQHRQQRSSPPPADKPSIYDETLRQQDETPNLKLRAAQVQGADTSPDRAAAILDLAKQTGLPPEVVDRNYDEILKNATSHAHPYQLIVDQTPTLAEFAAKSPQHAAVLHDDMENMGALEWLVKMPSRAIAQTLNAQGYGALRTKSLYAPLTQDEQDLMASYKIHMTRDGALGVGDSWFKKALTGFTQFTTQLGSTVPVYGLAGGAAGVVAGGLAGTLVGPEGTIAGAIAGGKAGLRYGSAYGLAKMAWQTSTAQAYDSLIAMKDETGQPLDPQVAKMAAFAIGTANAGLMVVGGKIITGSLEAAGAKFAADAITKDAVGVALRSPTVRGALLQASKDYAKGLGEGTAVMVGMKAAEILGVEIAKNASGQPFESITPGETVRELGTAAKEGALTFAIASAVGPSLSFLHDVARVKQADRATAFFQTLGGLMGQSKTAARLPDAMQEFLTEATKDGPIEHVYAPVESNPAIGQVGWREYWQSKGVDPVEMATKLTGDPDALARAEREGSDLQIPTAAYATTLARTEHNAVLQNELRLLSPDDMNRLEADAFRKLVASQDAKALEAPPQSTVHGAMLAQLTGAGVPAKQAQHYADLYEAAFTNLAQRAGVSPETLYQQYGLSITREHAPAAAQAGERTFKQEPTPQQPEDALSQLARNAPPQQAGPLAGLAEERRAVTGASPTGIERRNLPLEGSTAERAAAMRAEIPNIDQIASERRAAALTATRGRVDESAVFLGHGESGPLYNIVGGPRDGSTVSAETLRQLQIDVPETPAATGERLNGDELRRRALEARSTVDLLKPETLTGARGEADILAPGAPHDTSFNLEGYNQRLFDAITDPDRTSEALTADGPGEAGSTTPPGPVPDRREPLTDEALQTWAKDLQARVGPDLEHFSVLLTLAGDIQLGMLMVDRGARRAGLGSDIMLELTRLADREGTRIILSPSERNETWGTTSRERLIEFYKRFGFVENAGANIDPTIRESMYRDPTAGVRELYQKDDVPGEQQALAKREPPAPPLYSRLNRAVEAAKAESASGSNWKSIILGSKTGISKDEFAYVDVGMLEDGTKYTKQEVLDFLTANTPREVTTVLADREGNSVYRPGDIEDDEEIEIDEDELRDRAQELYDEAVNEAEGDLDMDYILGTPTFVEDEVEEEVPVLEPNGEQTVDVFGDLMYETVTRTIYYPALEGGYRPRRPRRGERHAYGVEDRPGTEAIEDSDSFDTEEEAEEAARRHLRDIDLEPYYETMREQAEQNVDYGDYEREARDELEAAARERRQQELEDNPPPEPDRDEDEPTPDPQEVIAGRTHYKTYTLSGALPGTYREIFLTVPELKGRMRPLETGDQAAQRVFGKPWDELTDNEQRTLNAGPTWRDGHSGYEGIKNPYVRIRLTRRMTPDGRPVLFLEEVQPPTKLSGNFQKMPQLYQDNWRELAFKWALRHAAETGAERVAWTTGQQQIDRYPSIEQVVKQIESTPAEEHRAVADVVPPEAHTHLVITPKDRYGEQIYFFVDSNRQVIAYGASSRAQQWVGQSLDSIISKEIADKLLAQATNTLEGEGQVDGAQGLRSLYDSAFRDVVNRLPVVKKTKGRVTTEPMHFSVAGTEGPTANIQGITFTPELRNEVMGGQARFQERPEGVKGVLRFGPDRQFNIGLFSGADESTVLHESGHFFLEVMGDLADTIRAADPATRTEAQAKLVADYEGVLAWLGVKDRSEIADLHHEQFARGFERYLMEGRAPSPELQGAYTRFRSWLTRIYQTVTALHVDLTPDVRGIFDRLVASDAAIADAEAARGATELFTTPESAGMTPDEFALYRDTIQQASETARDQLDRKIFGQLKREQSKDWADKTVVMRRQVEAELRARPEYRAIDAMRNGVLQADGTRSEPMKLSKAIVVERYGADAAAKLPHNLFAREGGLDPNVAAEAFGFTGGDELLQRVSEAPSLRNQVAQETAQRMVATYGNLLVDGTLQEIAKGAVANPDRDAIVRAELKALLKLQKTVEPFVQNERAKGQAALSDATAQAAYERRWLDAEAKLRIAMAEGRKQSEIDALSKALSDARATARGGPAAIRAGIPSAGTLRQAAIDRITAISLRNLKPDVFWSTSRRAAQTAIEAAARQDIPGAIRAKTQELLHLNFYREAEKVVEEINDSLTGFRDLNKADATLAKSRDLDYVNAARAILAKVGLAPEQAERAEQHLEKLRRDDPEVYDHLDDLISATPTTPDYKTLSVADFRTMASTVDSLWQLSLATRQIEIEGQKVDLAQARQAVLAQVHQFSTPGEQAGYKQAVSAWDRVKVGLLGFRASARRVEDWVTVVDNGREGPARRSIYEPINKGVIGYDTQRVAVAKLYAEIVKKLPPLASGSIAAPEIRYTFTNKQELLGALLHVGNGYAPGSNGDKLLRGRNWDRAGWSTFLDRMHTSGTLTRGDYDYVQAVWDLNASLKDAAQQVHKARFGRYFDEVTAVPVDTPFGQYAGGYFPAIADPFITPTAGERQRASTRLEGGAGGSSMFPSVGRGFTQTRVEGYAKPLILDASQVVPHLNAVLRFVHLSQPVSEVGRLILHPEFRAQLDAIDPAAVSDLLVPFLYRAASQRMFNPLEGKAGRAMDTVAREIRNRGAMQIIALNGTVLAEQFTHFPSVLVHPDVDATKLLGALWQLSRSPKKMTADIHEASPFMATRESAGLVEAHADINRVLLDESPLRRGVDWVQEHSRVLMTAIQQGMDNATWQAVYDKVAEEPGATHASAVERADSAVRQALGSYRPQDRAAIEGGNQIVGLLNQFYGFFNTKLNMLGTEAMLASRLGLQRKFSRGFAIYALGFMVPAILGEGIKNAMRGKGVLDQAETDDDTVSAFWRFWGTSQLNMGARMIPFGGAAVKTATLAFGAGKPTSILNAPAITMVENALHAPGETYRALTLPNATQAQKAKATTDFFTLIGLLSNLPMRPVGQAVNTATGQTTAK